MKQNPLRSQQSNSLSHQPEAASQDTNAAQQLSARTQHARAADERARASESLVAEVREWHAGGVHTGLSRRGQVEMIGLVIIVALLIVGIALYMTFSAKTSSTRTAAARTQGSTDFVVTLAATYLPACDVQFWEAAQACIEGQSSGRPTGKPIGSCDKPCAVLQDAVDAVSATALNGSKYNVSISSTSVQNMSDCPSANQRLSGVTESTTPIQLGSGVRANLTLALCK